MKHPSNAGATLRVSGSCPGRLVSSHRGLLRRHYRRSGGFQLSACTNVRGAARGVADRTWVHHRQESSGFKSLRRPRAATLQFFFSRPETRLVEGSVLWPGPIHS